MPDQVQQLIDRIGGLRRVVALGVALAAVVVIILVARWASAPVMMPVVNGVPLGSVGQLTSRLDQAGIKYELDNSGTGILVASPDVARARVTLAADGGIPDGGRPGMELFDQPSWSMTDFTQRINYQRALEGELERTIGKMGGIDGAEVHLALNETSAYATSRMPEEASVVLKTRDGPPSPDVVTGIAHLVASSVDGLRSEDVTIVDDAGHLLSEAAESNSAMSLTSHQLRVEQEEEAYLRGKVTALLSQLVGAGNARVQVSAAMNFDEVQRTTQTVDPAKQAVVSEQKAEIVPGAQGGAGSTNQATSYENSKSTEVYSPASGSIRRLTVAVLVNEKQTGTAAKPSFTPRSPKELAQIDSLVRSAVGIDTTRGDVVAVVSLPFNDAILPPPVAMPKPTAINVLREYQQPAIGLVGLLLAFVVALVGLRSVRSPARPRQALLASPVPNIEAAKANVFTEAVVSASAAARTRVLSAVDSRPDDAARLMRAWLKES
ncbi:MAG TPA: flagellar basal-body MS-ring/collar protein FliF [Gemmatimonadaceae bacterium]|nr:flagellar basal-body MS-ring/collar protein FliF [Gemmatimonadaceae bacterium]